MRRPTACALALLLAASARAADTAPAPGYEEVARRLEKLVEAEVGAKRLPAVAVALVDGPRTVWARGFGWRDAQAKEPATADSVFRVGTLAHLFTDLAALRLAERGALDLDAPVAKYLPDFKPAGPPGRPVTLRHLMAHRSGLVREAPVGGRLDDSGPSLEATVASLARTELLFEPGAQVKPSNAAVAAVGLALEKTQGRPFARHLAEALFEPMGMGHTSFEMRPEMRKALAKGTMGTYHGRDFSAPTFEPGELPAVGLYSTAGDMALFLGVLFADGKGPGGAVVKPETVRALRTPQLAGPGAPSEAKTLGLGLELGELEGRPRAGHGGGAPGFTAELTFLPEEKLGVVVLIARDHADGVARRVADDALRLLLARKAGKPLPGLETTEALPPETARRLAGRYRTDDRALELTASGGRLYAWRGEGGPRFELRGGAGGALVGDDLLRWGTRFGRRGDALSVGAVVLERVAEARPEAAPRRWLGLIGEYGPEHGGVTVLEKDGRLHALVEWYFLYPLEEKAGVYRFPDHGLYRGEKVVFTLDGAGRATAAEVGGVALARRALGAEDGKTFRIAPRRPLADIRKEALAAKPPAEGGELAKPDLVDVTVLDVTIKLDIRYATEDNFLGTPFYTSAKAFLQRPAAEALARAHKALAKEGYGVLVHDAYRPWSVTKMFWEATPERWRHFVADPAQGSRHNRGCAVDLTLYDLKTGRVVEMVGGYDEFSDRSYPDYVGGTSSQRWHRELLRRTMEAEGFAVYEAEWWHYDYKDWKKYPINNLTFEEIEARLKGR